MRTVTITWDLPPTREDEKPLPQAEIAFTEVFVSDGAGFMALAKIKPDETQTVERDMPDGEYTFRFIVTDIFGLVGKPVDARATVRSAPPGGVLNVKVTIS